MARSRVKHKDPIMGLLNSPYTETYARGFGLYLWWAFCIALRQVDFEENQRQNRLITLISQKYVL